MSNFVSTNARSLRLLVILPVALAGCNGGGSATQSAAVAPVSSPTAVVRAAGYPAGVATMTVSSATFASGAAMPTSVAFAGCGGGNVSPQLSWTGAPASTASYVVTEFDADAPSGSGFYHWTLFDIPASVTSLAANAATSAPAGSIQGYTDFGASGYAGPCPPVGDGAHRYNFTVLALDEATIPGVDATSTGAFLTVNILAHVVAKGNYVGTYSR